MARSDCPDCGEPLAINPVRCTTCGYRPGKGKAFVAEDGDAMRCVWISGSERCNYAGSMSPSASGGGPWYCAGHFGCDDGAHGQRIVDESRRAVRGRTWTASAMRDASKRAFLDRPIPPIPPVPSGVRYPVGSIGAFSKAFEVAQRHSPRAEAAAERAAIQEEGTF